MSLGKRKRVSREQLEQPSRSPSPSSSSGSESEEEEDLQDAFRRAFEAKFKPLDDGPKKKKKVEDIVLEDPKDQEEDDSDWSGISSEEEDEQVQVFDYANTQPTNEPISKAELRAFMVRTQNIPPKQPHHTS